MTGWYAALCDDPETRRLHAERDAYKARIDAAIAEHSNENGMCAACRVWTPYPCPTVRALTADVELTAGSVDATDSGPEDGPAPGQVERCAKCEAEMAALLKRDADIEKGSRP